MSIRSDRRVLILTEHVVSSVNAMDINGGQPFNRMTIKQRLHFTVSRSTNGLSIASVSFDSVITMIGEEYYRVPTDRGKF